MKEKLFDWGGARWKHNTIVLGTIKLDRGKKLK
jgi:hypothetical protein